jgi:hypothetical protein
MNAKTLVPLGAAALAHSPKTPVTAMGFSPSLPFAKFVKGIVLPFTPADISNVPNTWYSQQLPYQLHTS